ncbi:MAG: hypothetical protein ACKO96_23015 [Flammeovirgaceae bacterium]
MKNLTIPFTMLLLLTAACGKNNQHEGHHEHGAPNDNNPNQALQDQVMDVHDELMPQMEDIFKLKKEIQSKIDQTPDMVADKKKQLEEAAAQLDSANQSMMDWMHKFRPLPDSANREKAREYLETEMEKVKKLKTLFNESINKAKEIIRN